MSSIEDTFVHPDTDVNEIIEIDPIIRTLGNNKWEYAIQRLESDPNLNAVCVLYHYINNDSYWLMRSINGPVMRVMKGNKVVYQRPY
jgi:hypothetical protein